MRHRLRDRNTWTVGDIGVTRHDDAHYTVGIGTTIYGLAGPNERTIRDRIAALLRQDRRGERAF